ncbi:MAG: hypothetical protein CMP59_04125 [Flavobacteriales bacterium]|nr:hypothetical protein [Flavobacteriales bacterium]|tara:strand:+ start:1466 stop:2110 length:645 start_codon:yes stop_codon:yes gene_type:complete
MSKTNPEIDLYLKEGCGRCELFKTPDCKVHSWTDELGALRQILLSTELKEERKWGVACYTHQSKNIVMLSALKDFVSLSFLKGSLIKDPDKILSKAGENSHIARLIKFKSLGQVEQYRENVLDFIKQAIEIEKSGKKVKKEAVPEEIPEELKTAFENDAIFKEAFEALTPGRKRGYLIHFNQAKQSKTRISRIEKYRSQIMNGIGIHDIWKQSK